MSISKDKASSLLSKWSAHQNTNKKVDASKKDQKKYTASKGQQRLFFLDQLNPDNPVYNLTEIWDIVGDFDPALFTEALNLVGHRQDILRTTFQLEGEDIICNIQDDFKFQYQYVDLLEEANATSRMEDIARGNAKTIFNLTKGPLLRMTICQWEKQSYRVIINVHHIISDKWSMRILRRELSTLYILLKNKKADTLAPIESQYIDYVREQNQYQINPKSINYWKKNLSGLNHIVSLPATTNQLRNTSLKGVYSRMAFPHVLHSKVLAFCKQEKVTPFIFFLSIFKIVIHKYTSLEDIVVGTPTSTRTKQNYENIIGFFNDTIALRSQLIKGRSFTEFLITVKNTFYNALEHKDVGFEKVLSEVNPSRQQHVNPLFQMMFLYHKEYEDLEFAETARIDVHNYDMGVSKFDLTLYVSESSNAFDMIVEYAIDLYTEDYIQRLHRHIHELVRQVIYNSRVLISELSCLGQQECDELIKIGSGNHIVINDSRNWISQLFQNADPQATALTDEETSITYAELDSKSNQIAAEIRKQNRHATLIAILLDQTVEFVTSMIGVLKAGAAYLPIDISYPIEHIQHVLDDSAAELIISKKDTALSQISNVSYLHLEDVDPSQDYIPADINPESTAYIIYTSGSTGKPNGVSISHKNLINSTQARFDYYDDHPDAFLLLSSFSFDSSVAGIYWTLMNGGNIVIPKKRSIQDTALIADLMINHGVSHTLLIPSLYLVFLEYMPLEALSKLKLVTLAGEALSKNIASKHLEKIGHVKLYNEYGPTEATVWSSVHQIKSVHENGAIPIGKAIANTILLILDDNMNLVPQGLAGELCIAGPSVSNGYQNAPEKTTQKFVTKVLSDTPYTLYKTGDLVKWNAENELIFLGRKDHQVKVRGYRIELGEIDSAILNFSQEIQSATIYSSERKELVSYIVSPQTIDRTLLSSHIAKKLPQQFIPDHIIQLDEYPLMSNGKVDHKILRARDTQTKKKVKSKNRTTHAGQVNMLSIWRDILQNDELSIDDNFFEAGGDSIQIIRIIAKARKEGYTISPKDIYSYQSIAELNTRLNISTLPKTTSIEWSMLPLSPIQAWFFETHQTNPHHWLQGYSLGLKKSTALDVCKSAIQSLIAEYEIFQTSFIMEYGQWFHKKSTFDIEDFILHEENTQAINAQLNLATKPLAKFILKKEDDTVVGIQIIIHHLIVDAVSWSIILSFLEDKLLGQRSETRGIGSSYFHWMQRQQLLAKTKLYDASLPFWKSMLDHSSTFFPQERTSLEKNIKSISGNLDKTTTENIAKLSHRLSSLNLEEVMIASFLQVFYKNANEQELTVMLERHGRTLDDENIDLTESVGWHTAYFPIHFSLSQPTSLIDSLIDVKEQLRRVPHNGQSYGILKYLSKQLDTDPCAYVVINYLGHISNTESEAFNQVEFLTDGMRDLDSERDCLIEINAWIKDGLLEVNFAYDHSHLDQETMHKLYDDYITHLRAIPSILENTSTFHSPSDFNYSFSQEDLDAIFEHSHLQNSPIQDILDLSSIQSALLFHNLQKGAQDQGLITASVNINGSLENDNVQTAWAILINKHDALRSYFLWEELSKPAQVICQSVDSQIEFVSYTAEDGSFDEFMDNWNHVNANIELTLNKPPLYQLICFEQNNKVRAIRLICHHIYLDGWSTLSLFEELIGTASQIQSKQELSKSKASSLRLWKNAYNKLRNSVDTKMFWETYLSGVQATHLKPESNFSEPTFELETIVLEKQQSDKIRTIVAESKITLNVFFIGIWSWLLSTYVKNPAVVIGLTRSGRSLPIDDMDKLIGMFSTVLPFRFHRNSPTKIDFKKILKDVNEFLERDAINLDDLALSKNQEWSNLFDTLLIIQNFVSENKERDHIYISDFTSKISSLIPLSIIVIPGEKMAVTFRYNSDKYSTEDIQSICEDLIQLIQNISCQESEADIKYVPKYEADISQKNVSPSQIKNSMSRHSLDISDLGTEDIIRQIWQDVLQKKEIKTTDNFFQWGGTSLLAVRIFSRINESLGINASPILLIKHNTVERLSKALGRESATDSWSSIYTFKTGKTLAPLFCFHAGEGHILFYKELAEAMQDNRPVYGVQAKGLNGKDLTFDSIEEMASFYITEMRKKHPQGPYHLLGTCFSNAVTFEIAKQIKNEIGSLIIVDSPPPYYNELSKLKKWMSWVFTFNIAKLSEAFNSYFKYSSFKKPTGDQNKNIFYTGKHLRDIMSKYQWKSQDIKITLVRSSQNANDKYKQYHVSNWNKLTQGNVDSIIIEGEHISLFEKQSARRMSEKIDQNLQIEDV